MQSVLNLRRAKRIVSMRWFEDFSMSTMLEAEVNAARNHTPWTAIKLAEMMKDLASEGADVTLTCDARPSVASRFWWVLRWTTADGRRWTADAQTLDLCLWRAAVREQKTRAQLDSSNTERQITPAGDHRKQ